MTAPTPDGYTPTTEQVAAGARAVMQTRWRFRDQPMELASAHADHNYDYACAVCRPDLDDGAARLARAVLEAAMATTEWGVRWPDGSVSTLDDDLDEFSEASAREYVADGCATLVSREVTEWREVTS